VVIKDEAKPWHTSRAGKIDGSRRCLSKNAREMLKTNPEIVQIPIPSGGSIDLVMIGRHTMISASAVRCSNPQPACRRQNLLQRYS